jgi:branched-chain amino acid transport system permease protein
MMERNRRYMPVVLLALAVVLFQALVSITGSEYILTQMTMSGYYILVIVGLTVLMGYTGQISIGHAGFFAIGGYTTAVLTTKNLLAFQNSPLAAFLLKWGLAVHTTDLYGTTIAHVSPWVSLVVSVLITMIISFLIGIPILKLKGHYLAMATLGFGTIIYHLVLGSRLFGEADGISSVPSFVIAGPLRITGDTSQRIANYYIAWFIVIAGIILLVNLINSRAGRALRAIHGSEDAASAMGVNTARYKLSIFVLSAVFAAVGGALLTHFNGSIGPSESSVVKSIRYVAIVAVGGMANIWGSLTMGLLLNFLSLRGYLGSYDDAFFGLMLIVIMLFFPDGLLTRETLGNAAGLIKSLKKRLTGKDKGVHK